MSAPVTLSIVVPSHNTRDLTLQCLSTLRRIDCTVPELIVVDDGSADGSAEAVASQFPDVSVLTRATAGGFSAAANLGLSHARGEILLLLNSDTLVANTSIPPLLAGFAENPRLGIAGAELRYPDGSPQWSGGAWPTPRWLFGLASGIPAWLGRVPGYRRLKPVGTPATRTPDWVSGAAMAVRRATWQEHAPLDESFSFYCQDLDLCRRAAASGWRVSFVPGFAVVHVHGATIGSRRSSLAHQNPARLWTDLLRYMIKHESPETARSAQRAILVGAHTRLAIRRVAQPFIPSADRPRWLRETEILEDAAGAVREMAAAIRARE